MSAFLCSNDTFAVIAQEVCAVLNDENDRSKLKDALSVVFSDYIERKGSKAPGTYSVEKIHRAIYCLNVRALIERYADETPEGNEQFYRPYEPVDMNHIETLRRFTCYIYQISDPIIEKMDIYDALVRLRDRLAYRYVKNLPEFRNSEVWD